jgi:hypothetical protein
MMLDEDLSCEHCLQEAIERRFLYYPNHDSARVTKLNSEDDAKCTICRKSDAKYSISIIMASLNKNKLLRERDMTAEADRNLGKPNAANKKLG